MKVLCDSQVEQRYFQHGLGFETEATDNSVYIDKSVSVRQGVATVPDALTTPINTGAIYTPALLAQWVAEELMRHVAAEDAPRILDPACGDGALLASLETVAGPAVQLVGVDIDANALSQARQTLPATVELHQADALAPVEGASVFKAWDRLIGTQNLAGIM